MRGGSKQGDFAAAEQRRRVEKYNAHRRLMREAGYDPDLIGITEVKPVCCGNCGKPIPWRILRGWQ